MLDAIEKTPLATVEVAEREVYCPQCANGRTQIRPGASSYNDRVPCQTCRPAAFQTAMALTTQAA